MICFIPRSFLDLKKTCFAYDKISKQEFRNTRVLLPIFAMRRPR